MGAERRCHRTCPGRRDRRTVSATLLVNSARWRHMHAYAGNHARPYRALRVYGRGDGQTTQAAFIWHTATFGGGRWQANYA